MCVVQVPLDKWICQMHKHVNCKTNTFLKTLNKSLVHEIYMVLNYDVYFVWYYGIYVSYLSVSVWQKLIP